MIIGFKIEKSLFFQIFLALVLVSLSAAADQGGHGGHDDYEYSPYHYEYKVEDDNEYLHFGQEEEDDGTGNVHGHYYVNLPDGRLQHVNYYVNGYSGYVAEVSYDGEAHHPSHHGHQGHDSHHSSENHGSGSGRFSKSLDLDSHQALAVQPVAKSGAITRSRLGKSEHLHSSSSDLHNVFAPAPEFGFGGQQGRLGQGQYPVVQGRVTHHN